MTSGDSLWNVPGLWDLGLAWVGSQMLPFEHPQGGPLGLGRPQRGLGSTSAERLPEIDPPKEVLQPAPLLLAWGGTPVIRSTQTRRR